LLTPENLAELEEQVRGRMCGRLRDFRHSIRDAGLVLEGRRASNDKKKYLYVRGYKEKGTISTAFDVTVMNDLGRFHLAGDVFDRLPQLVDRAAYTKQAVRDKLIEHCQDITKYGEASRWKQ
jgi:phosphoketolase